MLIHRQRKVDDQDLEKCTRTGEKITEKLKFQQDAVKKEKVYARIEVT
jgi:hypothetical protein